MSESVPIEEAQLVSKYLKRVRARLSSHSLKNRKISVRQFEEFCRTEWNTSLIDAETKHLDNWVTHMLDEDGENYAPRTVRNKVYNISTLYQFLKTWSDDVEENIAEDVDTSNLTKTVIDDYEESRYLKIDEYKALLDACDNIRDRLLCELIWTTGVRSEEATKIEYEAHIDTDNREIKIKSGKGRKTGETDDRTVYYKGKFARTLKEYLNRGGRDSYLPASDSPYLLVSQQAEKMSPNRPTEIIAEIADDAGIQDDLWEDASGRTQRRVTAHTLRYSFAVHRVKQGMPIVYLQDLMGHEDIEQTRDYLKFRDDDLKEAAQYYAPVV